MFDQLWKTGSLSTDQNHIQEIKLRNLKFDIAFNFVMKHFCLDGSDLFLYDSTPIYRVQGLTERFNDDVNHLLWPSQTENILEV